MVWAWRNRVLFSNRRKAGDAFSIHEQFYFDSVGMDVDGMPGLCYTGCNICHGLTELLIFHFIFWHISQYPLQPSSFMQVILGKRILPWHIRTVFFFPKKIRRKKKRKETINLKHIFHPTESSIWQWEVGTCYSCRWPNSFSRGGHVLKEGLRRNICIHQFPVWSLLFQKLRPWCKWHSTGTAPEPLCTLPVREASPEPGAGISRQNSLAWPTWKSSHTHSV